MSRFLVESGRNEPALKAAFCQRLIVEVLIELACRDNQATWDKLIDLAIWLNNLIHKLQQIPWTSQIFLHTWSTWASADQLSKMEPHRTHRTWEPSQVQTGRQETGMVVFLLWTTQPLHHNLSERTKNLLYCDCDWDLLLTPSPLQWVLASFFHFSQWYYKLRWKTQMKLVVNDTRSSDSVLPALIDSGTAPNFIDCDTAIQLQLPLLPHQEPPQISIINGGHIGTGTITHAGPFQLQKI